jgi:hypothetical protein
MLTRNQEAEAKAKAEHEGKEENWIVNTRSIGLKYDPPRLAVMYDLLDSKGVQIQVCVTVP